MLVAEVSRLGSDLERSHQKLDEMLASGARSSVDLATALPARRTVSRDRCRTQRLEVHRLATSLSILEREVAEDERQEQERAAPAEQMTGASD